MRAHRPPRGQAWQGPQIPGHLMRDIAIIKIVKEFDQGAGGISFEVERSETVLNGAVLPLSNEDLQRLPEGTSTTNTQKIYTNGAVLRPGQLIEDSLDGQQYTVGTELTHGPIHGLKRYIITKKGVAASGR